MRILLNGVEISASAGSRIYYDGATGTLRLNGSPSANIALPPPEPLMLSAPDLAGKMPLDDLERKVLILLESRGATRLSVITKTLLGHNPPRSRAKYLSILLSQLVARGALTRKNHKSGAGLFSIARKAAGRRSSQ